MITESNAVSIGREFFKMEKTVPVSAYYVSNLSKRSGDYFLVIFGEPNASTAIAAVDSNNGEVKINALLRGNGPQLNISKDKALEIVNANKDSKIEMVWSPGKLSHSQLYPIWKIYTAEGILYVNQEGIVAGNLESEMRG